MDTLKNTLWWYEIEGEKVGNIAKFIDIQRGPVSFIELKEAWIDVNSGILV